MNWTKRLPTEEGWYWWRQSLGHMPTIAFVKVNGKKILASFRNGEYILDDNHCCQWYGPLKEPGGDAIENCHPERTLVETA